MKISTSILTVLFCSCFGTTMAQLSNHSLNKNSNRQLDFLDTSFGNSGASFLTPDGLYNFFVHTKTLSQDNGNLVGIGFVNKDSLFNFQVALFRTNDTGQLDSSFGNNGWTFTGFTGTLEVRDAVLQADGKILVTGSTVNEFNRDVFLIRYTSEGIPDSTFGTGGVVETDLNGNADYAFGLAVDSSENIFVAGKTVSGTLADILVISYDQNGALRPSFGIEGKSVLDTGSDDEFAVGICVQTADRIIIGGESAGNFLLVGYTASAGLDLTFGQDGITSATFDILSVENTTDFLMNNSGQFYLVGSTNASIADGKKSFATAKFDANGFPDPSYGLNGLVQVDVLPGQDDLAQEAVLAANGELILTGYSGNTGEFIISTINLTPAGEMSLVFGELGVLLTDFDLTQNVAQDVFVQQDGKIVVSGYSMNGSLCSGFQVRYNLAKYVETFNGEQNIRIYPNPATTDLILEFTEIKEPVELFVFNIQGQLISKNLISVSELFHIDLRQYENGSYYLVIPQLNIHGQFIVLNN